jgi:glycerol-3-phosphate acyltransferase PlsY
MSFEYLLTLTLSALAYILGSVPFGLVVTRLFGGPDPRSVGSGNIGATNVSRTAGKIAGLVTLLADVGKGALPTLLAVNLIAGPALVSMVGLSAFLGHLFPVFLRFRGGKGVATACGVFLIISPPALFLGACVFLVMALSTRYVSVGSISAALSLPLFLAILSGESGYVTLGIAVAILVVLKHTENIKRLRKGMENRFRSS